MATKTVTFYLSGCDTSDYSYASISNATEPVGKASSNTTYATINLKTGRQAITYIYYTFDTSSIPLDATITSITCKAKGYIATTSTSYISTRQMQLFSGTTAKGSAVNLTTTDTVHTISAGSWTAEELSKCRLRMYAVRGTSSTSTTRAMQLYGAELTVTYSEPDTGTAVGNTPIVGNTTITNVAKTIAGGYCTIGGISKPVVRSYECIGGVWKPSFKTGYTWKKYTCNKTIAADGWAWSSKRIEFESGNEYSEIRTTSKNNGHFDPVYSNGELTSLIQRWGEVGYPWNVGELYAENDGHLYDDNYYATFDSHMLGQWTDSSGNNPKLNFWYSDLRLTGYYTDGDGTHYYVSMYEPIYNPTYSYSQGTYIRDVVSDNANAYPTNGRHSDGFWYVFQG